MHYASICICCATIKAKPCDTGNAMHFPAPPVYITAFAAFSPMIVEIVVFLRIQMADGARHTGRAASDTHIAAAGHSMRRLVDLFAAVFADTPMCLFFKVIGL